MAPMSSHMPKVGAGSIASRWRELHGSGSWAKLVDPLDSDLRASIIAYGEHAEAAYDGFNADENSPEAGSCLYSSAGLLAASGVSHPEYYTVTKFLYATCDLRHVPESSAAMLYFVRPVAPLREGPWWRQSNWTGYVAVATDEGAAALGRRDILVAWRGTVEKLEMIKDIIWASVSAEPVLGLSTFGKFPDATVHGGFLSVYSAKMDERSTTMQEENKTSAGEQALREVRRLMEVHKDEETSITVTGHSLGATLATFNAVDMVANGVNVCPSPSGGPAASSCPVTAILFACPKVGNATFKAALSSFPDLRALHVKNAYDIVPMYPSVDFGYVVDAATVTLAIDTDRSPYLRTRSFMTPIDDVLRAHNLECYLHALAGDQGAGKDFKLVVDRDVALVNKGTDSLKDDYPVPANWWVPNSKYRYKVMGVARFMLHNFNQEEAQE